MLIVEFEPVRVCLPVFFVRLPGANVKTLLDAGSIL